MNIEFYQGDGLNGPFGYCQGVFINWFLNYDNALDFSLEEDDEWDFDDHGEMAEECELEFKLRESLENPKPVLTQIKLELLNKK